MSHPSTTDAIIPYENYLLFMDILHQVGGDPEKVGPKVAKALSLTSPAATALWQEIIEDAAEAAEKDGYDKARKEMEEARQRTTPGAAARGPFTEAEMEVINSFKSGRGVRTPELVQRYVIYRFRKGARIKDMMTKFKMGFSTLKELQTRAAEEVDAANAALAKAQAKDTPQPPAQTGANYTPPPKVEPPGRPAAMPSRFVTRRPE